MRAGSRVIVTDPNGREHFLTLVSRVRWDRDVYTVRDHTGTVYTVPDGWRVRADDRGETDR